MFLIFPMFRSFCQKFGKLFSENRSLFVTPAILAAGTGIVALTNNRSLLASMPALVAQGERELVTLHVSHGTGYRTMEGQTGESADLVFAEAEHFPTMESQVREQVELHKHPAQPFKTMESQGREYVQLHKSPAEPYRTMELSANAKPQIIAKVHSSDSKLPEAVAAYARQYATTQGVRGGNGLSVQPNAGSLESASKISSTGKVSTGRTIGSISVRPSGIRGYSNLKRSISGTTTQFTLRGYRKQGGFSHDLTGNPIGTRMVTDTHDTAILRGERPSLKDCQRRLKAKGVRSGKCVYRVVKRKPSQIRITGSRGSSFVGSLSGSRN